MSYFCIAKCVWLIDASDSETFPSFSVAKKSSRLWENNFWMAQCSCFKESTS
jgi:hypothetical protein